MISMKSSKATTKTGISIKSRVKAGKVTSNHTQAANGLRVKSRVKAGGIALNHNQTVR